MYTVRYKSHHDAAKALKTRYTSDIPREEYLEEKLNSPAESRRVIYLHVPFCNKVCSFCPFHRPDELKRREYHHYLLEDIKKIQEYPYMQAEIDAVNFGGGTPTALLPEQMDEILSALRQSFHISKNAEISVETSATELTEEMLAVLVEGGVNRLSIGIQSFDNDARKLLGRRGSGERAAESIKRAIHAGIPNTSIDLIYNYPGQTEKRLEKDLEMITSLGIAGISFYSLMIHEKTPLYNRLNEYEKQELMDTEKEYRLFAMILDELGKSGFKPLELTKLVRNGLDRYEYMNIRHTGGSCIAIGHGAGGNIEEYLYHNSVHAPMVSDRIAVSAMGRVVSPAYRMLDELIYDMQKGQIRLEEYSEKLHRDLDRELKELVSQLMDEELLVRKDGLLVMTGKGLFWGNNIIDSVMRQL